MGDWKSVRMTSAAQVAELMGVDPEALPPADLPVEARYDELRGAGELDEALDYLGHALPRLEALSWAGQLLEGEARSRALPPLDRQALDHVLRWLGDPDDGRRRAARDAADAAAERSAERLLALAVFMSGGSISLPDLPPVLPPPEACSRLVVGALIRAAYRSDAPDAFLERALARGEAVAARGLIALASA